MILANHGIISSSGGFIPSTLNNDLIALYKAESNANDSLGTYNGTAIGGVTYTTGKSGNAFSLNGTTGYVNVGDVMDIGTSSWSYSIWFNSSQLTAGNYYHLFTKTYAAQYIGRIWANIYNNKLLFNFEVNTANLTTIESTLSLSTNTWYNVVYILDRNDKMKIYINGILNTVNTISGTNNLIPYASYNFNNISPFRLGAATSSDNTTPAAFFNGLIDEFGVWNRVLTQSEITELQTKFYPF